MVGNRGRVFRVGGRFYAYFFLDFDLTFIDRRDVRKFKEIKK